MSFPAQTRDVSHVMHSKVIYHNYFSCQIRLPKFNGSRISGNVSVPVAMGSAANTLYSGNNICLKKNSADFDIYKLQFTTDILSTHLWGPARIRPFHSMVALLDGVYYFKLGYPWHMVN